MPVLTAGTPGTGELIPIEFPPGVEWDFTPPWWFSKKFVAITLGTRTRVVIHFRNNPPHPFTVWHELRHAEQLQERGAFRYYLGWLWETFLHGYSGNRMELECDRVAQEKLRVWNNGQKANR